MTDNPKLWAAIAAERSTLRNLYILRRKGLFAQGMGWVELLLKSGQVGSRLHDEATTAIAHYREHGTYPRLTRWLRADVKEFEQRVLDFESGKTSPHLEFWQGLAVGLGLHLTLKVESLDADALVATARE